MAEPAVFRTERLLVRPAGPGDVELFLALWNDPRVMVYVGFPHGLAIAPARVAEQLQREAAAGGVFDRRLVAALAGSGELIGEGKLGRPDASGIAETDVKLRPSFWGQGYGTEIKQGLVDYLFERTGCTAVQATPNVDNIASVRMQEAVGGVRVGERLHEFPKPLQARTKAVHAYIYHVRRADWAARRAAAAAALDWPAWEKAFDRFLAGQLEPADPAHDQGHIRRVVAAARRLAAAEGADLAVVLPAAWLHDCVTVPKDSAARSQASTLAATMAVAFLEQEGYPARYLTAIGHAIAAHSFSAGIPPETVEARVGQDADRLDALGAIGIARTLALGGALGRSLYHPVEPFPERRPADDGRYTIDHFYTKLLHLADTMLTAAGRAEAVRRTAFMRRYLDQLAAEIDPPDDAGQRP